jgi:MFS family permease
MELLLFVAWNSLAHVAFVGSRMTTALFAVKLGANDFTVGLLMALFAVLPMLLSVASGRLIDRVGPRRPLLAAFVTLVLGALVPAALPTLAALYVSSTLIGTAFMLVHIGLNSIIGAHGSPEERAIHFSWLALSFSVSSSLGPLIAGYTIDHLGHPGAFASLAVFPGIALIILLLRKRPLPRPARVPGQESQRSGVLDLLRVPGLRHTFIVSGILAMGWDLYSFLMPVYGARLGLSGATIGMIMAVFALATFVVRLGMPLFVRRVKQWAVIAAAMAIAGTTYLAFPLVSQVPFLMALSFLLGIGLGSAQPVIMSLLYEASPPGRQGEAVGIRTTMLNASHTFIPLASGAVSAALGTMAPVFWLLALGLLAGGWFARARIR